MWNIKKIEIKKITCCCWCFSAFSHFELIANVFNIGRNGRDGTVGAEIIFLNQQGDILIIEEMTLKRYSRNTYG